MRAAVIERYGEPPVVKDVAVPTSGTVVEVTGAPINPVDISIASGKFYQGSPPTPYVPGGEGVGHVLDGGNQGGRVYFRAALPNGAMAERAISTGHAVPIPDSLDDGVASALGTPGIAAYLGLTRRAQLKKGETVLILAASGVLGIIGVQAAKLLGAGRVIAGARDERGLERARQLGADSTVDLKSAEGLTERIREAAGGPLQVVIDPVWGAPGVAALAALSPEGRFVQLGASAGAEATVNSGIVRGRYLSILGYTSFLVPWEEQADAYRTLAEWAAAGKIKVAYEIVPLEQAAEAWVRQKSSPHRKLVLSPQR
jgi:NADPH2:quinone reductase